jgi:hypothetical protein
MGKLAFINKVKWVRESMKNADWWPTERKRWADLAEKHGIELIGDGTPWGNDYHTVNIYTTDKGLEAWNAFTSDVLKNGTPDAWKYVQEFATDIISLN